MGFLPGCACVWGVVPCFGTALSWRLGVCTHACDPPQLLLVDFVSFAAPGVLGSSWLVRGGRYSWRICALVVLTLRFRADVGFLLWPCM